MNHPPETDLWATILKCLKAYQKLTGISLQTETYLNPPSVAVRVFNGARFQSIIFPVDEFARLPEDHREPWVRRFLDHAVAGVQDKPAGRGAAWSTTNQSEAS